MVFVFVVFGIIGIGYLDEVANVDSSTFKIT
jgi:hypothetical protein